MNLTPRETEIVGYLKAGRTQAAIADYLGISRRTVELHCSNAARKADVRRAHLIDHPPTDFDKAFVEHSPSYIYVARADNGRIKIGCSKDVERRIRALNSGQPVKVTLLAKCPGTVEDEQELHDKLAAARFSGEWYEPTRAVMRVVKALVRSHGV